jgi:YD repeat-containing protein
MRQRKITIEEELTDLRTEYSKTYKQGKDTYILEEYLEPIHFNSRGVWREIDNKVASVSKEKALDEELTLENKANRYRAGFAKNSRAKKLVRFQLGQAQVDLGLPRDAKTVQASVEENRVSYNGVYPDTDLVYYTSANGIKEEWILNQYNGQKRFSMTMALKGVEAKPNKDGSIDFVDSKGKTAFFIPRPFMFDANEVHSDNLKFEIREDGKVKYLDLILDEEWLQDPKRAYPVTVDPSIEIEGKSITYDSFVSQSEPDKNFGLYSYLTVGNNPSHGKSRALIQFTLQPLLSGATIESAELSLHQTLNNGTTERFHLYHITQKWESRTVTWNNQPSIGDMLSHRDVANKGWYSFDLTDLAKEWYSGETPNYGVALRMETEDNDRKSFRSSDNAQYPDEIPKLTIEYTIDPIGQESFWTSAVSNVNTYNGNFFLCNCAETTDVSISGRGIPASVERAYNSRASGGGIFGNKWTSNLEQKLTDSGDGPILYTDSDGTPHSFTANGDGTYEAPGGIYLELIKKVDGTYVMTDKSQTEIHFNTSGQLSKMVDSNGNTTTITYTSSRPTKITDASGREVTLSYNAANRVSQVTDPANRTVVYTYDGDGNLKTVTKKDGTGLELSTISYGYDGNQRITSITDPNGNKTTVAYNADNQVESISHPITVNGTVETATTRLSYSTTNNLTTVTNPKGKKTLYTHNAYGNVVQVIQDPNGLKIQETFIYNDKNELISQKDANTNSNNSQTAYNFTYDENGNVTSIINQLNEVFTAEYDENNNLIKETDPKENTFVYEYDDESNPTSRTDPVEKSSAQKYDSNGNLIEETSQMSPGNNLARNGSFEIHRNSSSWPDDWRQTLGSKPINWANGGLTVEGITLGERSNADCKPHG